MTEARTTPAGHDEPHDGGMATRLNWLRAAVLGANDGIVSTAGMVVGVAGAVLPLLAITLAPAPARVAVTVVAVLAALAGTGTASAALGRASRLPVVIRNVMGCAVASRWPPLSASPASTWACTG